MILPRIISRRFFNLFDVLTIYANDVLDVVDRDELLDGSARGVDEGAQAKVASELWENLPIIDRFVEENPADLSFGELETIRSWRSGLTGDFIVWKFPDGTLRFMMGGYAFEVWGFSKDIEDMLHGVPAVVRTTLLPFDGRIVYSEYLSEVSAVFGEGIVKMFGESAEDIMSKGLYVATADGLLQAAARIREAELARDLEELAADLDSEGMPDEPAAGQHRGVLADMAEEQREAAVRAQMDADIAAGGSAGLGKGLARTLLDEHCTPGPVTTSLAELLADMPTIEDDVLEEAFDSLDIEEIVSKYEEGEKREYAREFLDKSLAEMKAAYSANELAAYLSDPDNVADLALQMNEGEIMGYRRLMENGGRMSVAAEGLATLAGLPMPKDGLCYAFQEGDSYEFVIPDEVLGVVGQVDWDAALAHARKHKVLVGFFDHLTELRGIVKYDDAMADYFATVPDPFDSLREANDEFMAAIETQESDSLMLDDGEETYVLYFELMWEYLESQGRDPHEDVVLEEGPLDDMLKGLLRMQEGKPTRVPSAEMLAEHSLYQWKEKQPPARAMRNYLDAHVPDGKSDYYFADKVLESLIDEAKWGGSTKSATYVFDVLEENGFVPEESQLQTLLNLWMNLCNGLPIWANNGWSPAEIASSDPERPVFFNEDGSVKKVGRNDPCPCGSGKKYKKCCGR